MTVHESRRSMYAFLSQIYEREVTLDVLKELVKGADTILRDAFPNGLGDDELRRGFQELGGYLKDAAQRDTSLVKLELAAEYASLFLGVKGKPPHPSESVYLSKEHSLYQESRDRVQAIYWDAGVDKKKEYTEPEDHVAIELQFMEYLCRKTAEALAKGKKDEAMKYLLTQHEFINDHLSKWIPQLVGDILESAEVDFYKGIAEITDAFVRLDERAVPTYLDEVRHLEPH